MTKSLLIVVASLGLLVIAGCAQDGATPLNTAKSAAPPPSNLSPEEKKAYEEAVKNAGPSAR